MGRVLSVLVFGGAGFWLGAYYRVPPWVLWSLLVLGTLMWILGEWLERRETKRGEDHDETSRL
jgi:hypothetical protein